MFCFFKKCFSFSCTVQSQQRQVQYSNIIAGITFDIDVDKPKFDTIGIRAEGSYGNLPNLDLVNTVVRVGMRAGPTSWMHPLIGLDNSRVSFVPSVYVAQSLFVLFWFCFFVCFVFVFFLFL